MDNQGPNNYNNGNNNYNNNGGNGGGGNGNNGGNGGKDNHNGQLIMAFVLVSLIVLFIMSMVSNRFSQMSTQEISYSQFLEKVEAGEVKSVEIGSYEIDITPVTKDKSPYQPTYYCGRVADEDLIPLLKEKRRRNLRSNPGQHFHLDLQYFKLSDPVSTDLGTARIFDEAYGRRCHGCWQEQCESLRGKTDGCYI